MRKLGPFGVALLISILVGAVLFELPILIASTRDAIFGWFGIATLQEWETARGIGIALRAVIITFFVAFALILAALWGWSRFRDKYY